MQFLSWWLAALIAVASAPLGAQVLTLEEARRRALDAQPALRALQLQARAAEDAASADGALPDPRLKLGALNMPTRGFPSARDDMTQFAISLEQPFPGGDKRRLKAGRARAEAEQARAEELGTRQQILRDVALAWLDAWQAGAAERLALELQTELERAAELARIAQQSARGSRADTLAARQLIGMATDRRLELSAQAERSRAAVARWAPGTGFMALAEGLPEFADPLPLASLRETLEHHPQHAMHLRAQGVADADVALAREGGKSDRSVEVGYMARSGADAFGMERSDMVMLQLTFELPLYAKGKQDRVVESKLRLAERAREQRADHLRQLGAELDAAYADWRLAGERRRNLAATVLPDAQARLDALVAAHGAGTAPLSAVFDARRQLIEARVQELALRAAQAKARVALQYFEHEEVRP